MRTRIRKMFIVLVVSSFIFELPMTTTANGFRGIIKSVKLLSRCSKSTEKVHKGVKRAPNTSNNIVPATANGIRIINKHSQNDDPTPIKPNQTPLPDKTHFKYENTYLKNLEISQ